MLEVLGASSYYGDIQALKEASLRVGTGEIVTLIGANGAGKTTLLHTICGALTARKGKVMFEGRDITTTPAHELVRLGISHVPERRQIFGELAVLDNLRLGAYHRGGNEKTAIARDIDMVFELFPVLKERRRQMAGTLSGGQQQMLAVGRGLMAKPRLLLLDEPSLGLAPLIVKEIMQVIAELRNRGTTVLLVEQNARAALRVADRGYLMETGRIVMEDAARDLLEHSGVQSVYLGKDKDRVGR